MVAPGRAATGPFSFPVSLCCRPGDQSFQTTSPRPAQIGVPCGCQSGTSSHCSSAQSANSGGLSKASIPFPPRLSALSTQGRFVYCDGERGGERREGLRGLGLTEETDVSPGASHTQSYLMSLEGCLWGSPPQHGGHCSEGKGTKAVPGATSRGGHSAALWEISPQQQGLLLSYR